MAWVGLGSAMVTILPEMAVAQQAQGPSTALLETDPIYLHGTASWKTEPGFLYRVERSNDMQHWISLPETYYGMGQTVSRQLHPDLNPEVAQGINPAAHPPLPPAASVPQFKASGQQVPSITWARRYPALVHDPLLPALPVQPQRGLEVIVTQQESKQVAHSYRQWDLKFTVDVRNRGSLPLDHVQVQVPPFAMAFAQLPGVGISVVELAKRDLGPGSVPLTLNSDFNWTTSTNLLDGSTTLPAGVLGSAESQISIYFTVRFTFDSFYAIPRTPRFLYAVASGGTGGTAANLGGTWSWTDNLNDPSDDPLGYRYHPPVSPAVVPDVVWEVSEDRYAWLPLGPPGALDACRATAINFFATGETFTRYYQLTRYANGTLATWYSPVTQTFLSQWLSELTIPNISAWVTIDKFYPAPGPYVAPPPGLPTFGAPTRLHLDFMSIQRPEIRANSNYLGILHESRYGADGLAASTLVGQVTEIHDEFQKQAAARAQNPPITPGPTNLANTDHDLTVKGRDFYRVKRYCIDSNFDNIFDYEQYLTTDDWRSLQYTPEGVVQAMADYAASTGKTVLINEFCPQNDGNFVDAGGNEYDWVELYNASAVTRNLDGWRLEVRGKGRPNTETYTFTASVDFPDFNKILPGHYLMVSFKTGAAQVASAAGYHVANFSLYNPGVTIVLRDAGGTSKDTTEGLTNDLNIPKNKTFGRYLDPFHAKNVTPVVWGHLATPTPGALNSPGYKDAQPLVTIQMVDAATLSPVSPGLYSRADHPLLTLLLTANGSSERIHYTTNGAVPTAWSAVYDPAQPPQFDRTAVIRAVALGEDTRPPAVATQTFLCKESVLGDSSVPAFPPQARPESYPEYSMPESWAGLSSGVRIPYDVNSVVLGAHRAELMAAMDTLPTVSLVCPVNDFFATDTAGIYACSNNTGSPSIDPTARQWARVASLAWFEPAGSGNQNPAPVDFSLEISGSTNISWFRTEKHSLSLSFKKELGAGKYFPQIPVFSGLDANITKFNSLILRNPTFDTWTMSDSQGSTAKPSLATYAKDRYARASMEALGYPQLHSRWVQVFINGLYWGIYLLSEKAEEATFLTWQTQGLLGPVGPPPAGMVPNLHYYVWKDSGGSVVGEDVALPGLPKPSEIWTELLENTDAVGKPWYPWGGTVAYNKVQQQMDIPGFIDYTLFHAFFGNFDAMTNNGRTYLGFPSEEIAFVRGKIKWLCYDIEVGGDPAAKTRDCFAKWFTGGAYGLPGYPTPAGPPGTEARILSDLLARPEFKRQFAERAWRLCLMPAPLRFRPEDGFFTGEDPQGKAQLRFKAEADTFTPYELLEGLRWGSGYGTTKVSTPFSSAAANVDYIVGRTATATLPALESFLYARRPYFEQQLLNHGLIPSIPMPTLVPGSQANTWILSAPANVSAQGPYNTVYYNTDGNYPGDPDYLASNVPIGTPLAAGQSVVISAANASFHLMARTRQLPDAGPPPADDIATWSLLLDVKLPGPP